METSPKHARDVTNTSLKDPQNTTKKTTKQHQNNTETSPKRDRDKTETRPRHDRDMTETSPKQHRDITEIRPRQDQDKTETRPRHDRDTTETRPRQDRDILGEIFSGACTAPGRLIHVRPQAYRYWGNISSFQGIVNDFAWGFVAEIKTTLNQTLYYNKLMIFNHIVLYDISTKSKYKSSKIKATPNVWYYILY